MLKKKQQQIFSFSFHENSNSVVLFCFLSNVRGQHFAQSPVESRRVSTSNLD